MSRQKHSFARQHKILIGPGQIYNIFKTELKKKKIIMSQKDSQRLIKYLNDESHNK